MVGWQSNGCVVAFFWVVCGGARGHQPQSLATYVACTKCVQVSLSETCMQLLDPEFGWSGSVLGRKHTIPTIRYDKSSPAGGGCSQLIRDQTTTIKTRTK